MLWAIGHAVLVSPRLARFFGFEWDGQYYVWRCLPFGFKLSAFVYCRIVRQLVLMWRRAGINILAYVDDQCGGQDIFFDAVLARNKILRDNAHYGFAISAKSDPLPFQRVTFLGFVEHHACPVPSFHTPQAKVDALREAAQLLADAPGAPFDPVPTSPLPPPVDPHSLGALRATPSPGVLIDLGSGVNCLGIAHALMHPDVVVIAVDWEHHSTFLPHIRPHPSCPPNLKFVKMDFIDLTLDVLTSLVRSHAHAPLSAVGLLHFSPQCTTISDCSGDLPVWDPEAQARLPHRFPDGSPQTSMARADDLRLAHVFELIHSLTSLLPHLLVHVENPVSKAWPTLPPVRHALSLPDWSLLRCDHCSVALPAFDFHLCANKPTYWVVFGVSLRGRSPESVFPVCVDTRACPMRSAVDPSVHAVVIRNRSAALHAARGQRCEWVTHDRSRIPGGMFARLWAAHVDRLAERPPSLSIPPSVSVRKLAKVAGRLLSMGLAVGPTCRLMSREMFAAMYSNDIQDWDGWVASNIGLVRELLWVVRHLCAWNNIGTPIWRDESCVDVVVTQDSSPTGVGFRLESPHAGKRVVVEGSIDFTTAESRLDHVHRELVGAVLAVFRAAPHLRGLCVQHDRREPRHKRHRPGPRHNQHRRELRHHQHRQEPRHN